MKPDRNRRNINYTYFISKKTGWKLSKGKKDEKLKSLKWPF